MYDYKEYFSRIHPDHGKSNEFLRNYYKEHGDYYEPADDPTYKEALILKSINLSGIGECGIMIFENDSDIPHFHIVGENFETALCIQHPLYYDCHDIDILSDNQIDELVNEVKAGIPYIYSYWNGNNLSAMLGNFNGLPNYNKLKGGKRNVFWKFWKLKHKGR